MRRCGASRRLMGPAIIGSSMGQLSVMISTGIASLLADGSMTWLYFADRLVEFPLGVFSIALATVILPSLSAQHAQRTSAQEFSATLAWAMRLVCLIVDSRVGGAVRAGRTAHGRDLSLRREFTPYDVEMTQLALMAFSFALLGWSLIKVLAPGYYARQDTKGPVRVAMWALGVTMALNLVALVVLWRDRSISRRRACTRCWLSANGVGALFNAASALRRPGAQAACWPRSQGLGGCYPDPVASAVMGGFSCGSAATSLAGSWSRNAAHLVADGSSCGGVPVYFLVLWLLGVRPSQLRLQPPAVSA